MKPQKVDFCGTLGDAGWKKSQDVLDRETVDETKIPYL